MPDSAHPSPDLLSSFEHHQAQQLAREVEALKLRKPMDVAKRPGGYFIGTDGTPHDAEGRPVPPIPEDDAAAPGTR